MWSQIGRIGGCELTSPHKYFKNTSANGTVITEHLLNTSRIPWGPKRTRKIPWQPGRMKETEKKRENRMVHTSMG